LLRQLQVTGSVISLLSTIYLPIRRLLSSQPHDIAIIVKMP
jgi:hypothetical protein